MFVRQVNGRAYLAESVRVGGRVVQRHWGRALPELISLTDELAAEREEERRIERERRREENERERRLAEQWDAVRREFESSMRSAGYHNPNGRGWRRRRGRPPAR
jgi:hypothetical protein